MSKKKKSLKEKNHNKTSSTKDIHEIYENRTGGQNALRGYTYQMLYSCFLILSTLDENSTFVLEGVEDIDYIYASNGTDNIKHIQIKYSTVRQSAEFLEVILKNFIEVYLLDPSHSFQLVYDFDVAKGNLSNLMDSELDDSGHAYWSRIVNNIKAANPQWNWSAFNFDDFLQSITFQKIKREWLEKEIQKVLVDKYGIITDNLTMFINALKVLCLESMTIRACVSKKTVAGCIQSVKDDIDKGIHNPAYKWINRLEFIIPEEYDRRSFFEGKKAIPADIASGVPVKRQQLEKEIITSIDENTVTVIKAPSGQGKTTLALQAINEIQSDYTPYQILWCNDAEELDHIVRYFKARIQVGEKLILLIDNLDENLKEWNRLAQRLQSELMCHYKLLVTSREEDWYNYNGDLSKIHSLNIIKPLLTEQDAIEIYTLFRDSGKLHPDVSDWKKSWDRVAERQLLIEYVYLLTHGEMLSDRISYQMANLGKNSLGGAKLEILRKVCFADICGIHLSVERLMQNQALGMLEDFGEVLRSLEDEFLVHVNDDRKYIEGLHPIRSEHIVDRLHEWVPLDYTALSVIQIADIEDYPVLFSHIPEFKFDETQFYNKITETLWNVEDLSVFPLILQGLFSGSAMQYYRSNKLALDDANMHGGLISILPELCPFSYFPEIDVTIETLNMLRDRLPQNENIRYLCDLRDSIPTFEFESTCIYHFCCDLYNKLYQIHFSEIEDLESFASIAEWLYNIGMPFELFDKIDLDSIWCKASELSLGCLSTLMYISYCGNRDVYEKFVRNNFENILRYLKYKTFSHKLYVDEKENAIHVEYILPLIDTDKGNDESVSRIKYICRTLPIYDTYCADALKPENNALKIYSFPAEDHKVMPLKNVVILFHQQLMGLWNKTILTNFECDSITEWIEYWFDIRNIICSLIRKCSDGLCKILKGEQARSEADLVDKLRNKLSIYMTEQRFYPHEDRPFEEKPIILEEFNNIKNVYFQSIRNFSDQFPKFIVKDEKNQRLTMVNLKQALESSEKMQNYFLDFAKEVGYLSKHNQLCDKETKNLNFMIMTCQYYIEHSSSNHFNKLQINPWYTQHCHDDLRVAEKKLSNLQPMYSVCFPVKTYQKNVLTHYPIAIKSFDYTSESQMVELLINCVGFADVSFDYLVILFSDYCNSIYPKALRVPKQWYLDIKNKEDLSTISCFSQPLPIPVSEQILDCFQENFLIQEYDVSNEVRTVINDLAEKLWIYSKLLQLPNDTEDEIYFQIQLQENYNDVLEKQEWLRKNIPENKIEEIDRLCLEVFNGKSFDDYSYNEFINAKWT